MDQNLARKLSCKFFLQNSCKIFSYVARKASFLVQDLQDLLQDLAKGKRLQDLDISCQTVFTGKTKVSVENLTATKIQVLARYFKNCGYGRDPSLSYFHLEPYSTKGCSRWIKGDNYHRFQESADSWCGWQMWL